MQESKWLSVFPEKTTCSRLTPPPPSPQRRASRSLAPTCFALSPVCASGLCCLNAGRRGIQRRVIFFPERKLVYLNVYNTHSGFLFAVTLSSRGRETSTDFRNFPCTHTRLRATCCLLLAYCLLTYDNSSSIRLAPPPPPLLPLQPNAPPSSCSPETAVSLSCGGGGVSAEEPPQNSRLRSSREKK